MKVYQEMEAQALLDVIIEEESRLCFDHFSNNEAFELGKCIVAQFANFAPVAIEIYINGHCKFSFFPDGTGVNNGTFLANKRRTVEAKEWSSLRMYAWLLALGRTQESALMPFEHYAAVGGGFPIRMKDGAVIGSVCVSGLPHFQDHTLLVAALEQYLGK
ncbi:heme-binding protein [Bengtsoniella intestinalis]|uniref:heme-binding protein n=1 Tax=Bengtsoniella intestinalis TaxID=3073143 RepID=UPI00391F7DAD